MPHARAGQLAQPQDLIDLNALLAAYQQGDPPALKPVSFGTSGHRGSAFKQSFNDAHIAAIVQAIVDYRRVKGIMGPLFLGKDTHALSAPAEKTALEVLAANSIETHYQEHGGFTPTPVISRAIIRYNAEGHRTLADGILITPSHNPPEDGGIKYNPPNGGPADTNVTKVVEDRANALLADEFLEIFDGFSIGSNDLTQLTLGLDRDSGIVAHLFDERNPAVKKLLSNAIQACNKAGKYIGICGQGPSDHPDLARWLMEQGIESVSLNPDSVLDTWFFLAEGQQG